MLLLAALSLATGALALLVARSTIFEPLRRFAPALLRPGIECTFCVSFWIALLLGLWVGPPDELARWPVLFVLSVWGGGTVVAALGDVAAP